MKKYFMAICLVMFACVYGHAQTVTSASGSIQVNMTDGAGGQYVITIPVDSASVVYTPPVVIPPPPPPPPPPPQSGAPAIPSNAVAVDLLTQGTWKACEHDAGTPGTATCSNNYPVTGIFADAARGFSMAYTNGGGARWANSFAKDTKATNFVLDGVFQSPDWTHVADLELDDNQVKADGKTAILGVQCASQEKAWDITLGKVGGGWHWVASNVSCNPMTWAPNTPHHVRIFGSIDAQDNSTYIGVELDGVYSPFTGVASGPTGNSLHWGLGSILTNFQIDGYKAAGSAIVYADKFTIYRW